MQLELSTIISKKYKLNVPPEIIKLILSFDLETSFYMFFQQDCDLEMVLTINYTSFYDHIIDLFRIEYYKHDNLILKIKDRKKLKYLIKQIIYEKKQIS